MGVARASAYVAAGVVGGLVLGILLTTAYQDRHAQALFSPRPRRRWAALGRLAGTASVDSVRLMREYVAWETHPRLRRRGEALLERLQSLHG